MAIRTSRKRKKTWFNIVTPKELGNYLIGETTAFEPQQLIGRNVQISLMNILNDPKKQNVQLIFKIKSVSDKNAITEIMKYELIPSYVKRMMRKGRNKIEDSFIIETKDKIKIRIKPFMITRIKTQRSKLSMIRKTIREFITEKVKTQNFIDLINDTISTKLQRELKGKLKKIYPLVICEFRMITKT